jgi:hypothetical protein
MVLCNHLKKEQTKWRLRKPQERARPKEGQEAPSSQDAQAA